MCDCNGHADSCHYNASLDSFPDSYDQGGGGVCDNCQSNTGQHKQFISIQVILYFPSQLDNTVKTVHLVTIGHQESALMIQIHVHHVTAILEGTQTMVIV